MRGTSTASVPEVHAQFDGYVADQPHLLAVRAGSARARRQLLTRQKPDGHWVGELQGDTILESEYVLLLAFLGRERDERVRKLANYLVQHQTPDGGWNNYPGGPVELSVSVKAYFALKLAGHDPQAAHMRRSRELILSLGGAEHCNSFTKFYLALLGQFPYDNCPSVPPEMMLLPTWAYFNIHAMSSWTRTIVVPLSIFYAYKPVRKLPEHLGVAELFREPPETPRWPHPPSKRLLTWTNFFLGLDQLFKKAEKWGLGRVRNWSLRRASQWMLDHFADSDGLGAIFPPMIYTAVCLRCLGYADDSPEMRWALKQLDDLMLEEDDSIRLQPCFSPVWDTALTLKALADAGVANRQPAIEHAVRWLLEKEVRCHGDWSVTNPDVEPGGWFFEYKNYLYPDTDDTAMVLMALARSVGAGHWSVSRDNPVVVFNDALGPGHHGESLLPPTRSAAQRGLRWLLAMQDSDGGWAAFDRNINKDILTKVPFADHNAMLDPSCPDITARVLEALGHFGIRVGHPQVDRAIAFIGKTQDPRGCWLGRWGVNYIYGTWQVLIGLKAISYDMSQPMVRDAVAWLKKVQQPGGGWGESCKSYDQPELAGQGPPTASQTAWALLGLLATGEAHSDEVRAGIDYLLATQQPDGDWREDQFTGTGFPKVFYLKYHMYSLYFPLMALAQYERLCSQGSGIRNQESGIRDQGLGIRDQELGIRDQEVARRGHNLRILTTDH